MTSYPCQSSCVIVVDGPTIIFITWNGSCKQDWRYTATVPVECDKRAQGMPEPLPWNVATRSPDAGHHTHGMREPRPWNVATRPVEYGNHTHGLRRPDLRKSATMPAERGDHAHDRRQLPEEYGRD